MYATTCVLSQISAFSSQHNVGRGVDDGAVQQKGYTLRIPEARRPEKLVRRRNRPRRSNLATCARFSES